MIIKDATWGANFAVQAIRYRGLNYSLPNTIDEIEGAFYQLCNRYGIRCDWFPFAEAIEVHPSTDMKFLSVLRGHAIEDVEQKLLRAGYKGAAESRE